MNQSFVESADSAYKFKKLIRESLGSKASNILSNKEFQQAAAFGLLEFQDEEDQKVPQMSPEEMIRFFSKAATYHDTNQTPNPIKRISSKADPHSEVPNEEMETVYKKLFGTSIDKDPAFAHFFESEEQIEEAFINKETGKPIGPQDRKPLTRTSTGAAVKAPQNTNPLAGKRLPPMGVKR